MKRFPLFSKTLMIGLLTLLLLIPLGMIESKISERKYLQTQVQQDIARSASGAQTLAGPYLVIHYKVRERTTRLDDKGQEKIFVSEAGPYETVIAPHKLDIDGSAEVETRHRGIYQARLYNLRSRVAGSFDVPLGYGIGKPLDDIIPQATYLVVNVSDSRGIRNAPSLTLNNQKLEFAPGSIKPLAGNGMHVPLETLNPIVPHHFDFSFPLDLQGMSTLAITPSGNQTAMTLKSPWPHPSFGGGYLPRQRQVDNTGFSASWLVTNLARNNAAQPGSNTMAAGDRFSVEFIDPVNVYLMSERAVKYGVMFVVLMFTSFFLFEVLKGLRIHPMQYLLVGLAMAMFFLLIISLSEHIPFWMAYVASGTACVALIGIYLAGVLKNRTPALAFSSSIALLYAVLYGVLQSEDNALLMGAVLLFTALAGVMLLTRRMDWYRLSEPADAQAV